MKRKSTGSRRTASGGGTGRSKNALVDSPQYPFLAICVENRGNEVSLELGKTYQVIRPEANEPCERLRVIDEDGEDYLYPAEWFVPVELSPGAKRRVMRVTVGST